MPKSLVVVESPAKAKTIKKILGRDYIVDSSVGHIRDLPKNDLGVDIDNAFTPKYVLIRGKGKVVKALQSEARTRLITSIWLQTRIGKGEAICWHLAEELKEGKETLSTG